MNGCGHDDCQRSSAVGCLREPTIYLGYGVSVGQATADEQAAHHHHWTFDGAAMGWLIYHCDDHDPPVVRQVWPGVTL